MIKEYRTFAVIEKTLFHGTTKTVVSKICHNEFNRSLCGQHGNIIIVIISRAPVEPERTGTPFRFLFGRTVVQNLGLLTLLLSSRVTRLTLLMLLETDYLLLIITRCDIGDFLYPDHAIYNGLARKQP